MQLSIYQNSSFKPILKSSNQNISLFTLLLIVFFLLGTNCQIYPVNPNGPLYTDNIQYVSNSVNPLTLNSINYTYNGWQFTSNMSSLPQNYILFAIQSIYITIDTGYLTFYLSSLIIKKTFVYFEFYHCQSSNSNCLSRVVLRLLAIDYHMLIDNNPYTQIMNGLFLYNSVLSYSPNYSGFFSGVDLTNYGIVTFLNGFRLQQGPPTFVTFNYLVNSTYFGIRPNFFNNAGPSFVTVQILFYSKSIIQSQGRFRVSNFFHYIISSGYTVIQNYLNAASYYQGETLIFGIYSLNIYSAVFDVQTTIYSVYRFNSTTSLYTNGNSGAIGVQWFRISKIICPSNASIYIYGINECDSVCPSQGYYIQNTLSCYPCQNPRCLQCTSSGTYCSSCDISRAILSDLSDCIHQIGYYQNNLSIAGKCIENCSICQNGTSCDVCFTNYFYQSLSQICLICGDIVSNCQNCTNSFSGSVICSQCNAAYYVTGLGTCLPCVIDCISCLNAISCDTCLTSDYLYSRVHQKCQKCQNLFENCMSCSNSSGAVRCIACQTDYVLNISVAANYSTQCFSFCGDKVIQPFQQCDDGNNISFDGCSVGCQLESDFTCVQTQNIDYPAYNFTECYYANQVYIKKTYLQKIPDSNKVSIRFNFQPELWIFFDSSFLKRLQSVIQVLWNGYKLDSLQVLKVQNALHKNGLFQFKFSYELQWNNVSIQLNLANSNLSFFTLNPSRLLLQANQFQNIELKQEQMNRILTTSGQTPLSTIILPQKSDNNLVMFSNNYNLYSFAEYGTYFMVSIIWIYWLVGLFYGKMVVIDFILVLQIIFLSSITTGTLSTGFSGMMLEGFSFYNFNGALFYKNYQIKPVYENINAQLKSANIYVNPFLNIGAMLIVTFLILLIGIIAKILSRYLSENIYILNLIEKYAFGEFLFYNLLPYQLLGCISTVLYLEALIQESISIQFVDVLALIIFNLLTVLITAFLIKKPQHFGEFRTHLLRFDISQHFYVFVIIYVSFMGYSFDFFLKLSLLKFQPIIPIVIFILIIVFNIYKKPYFQDRNQLRVYTLYGVGILLLILILVQNIVNNVVFNEYIIIVIVCSEFILAFMTGYYLMKSIKLDGKPKFDSFLLEFNQKKIQAEEDYFSQSRGEKSKVQKLNKAAVDYYQKQSKLLQNIKKNSLYESVNLLQKYQDLKNLPEYDQNYKEGEQSIEGQSQQTIQKLMKNPKFLKMSLKNHLVNQVESNNVVPIKNKEKNEQKLVYLANLNKQTEDRLLLKKNQDNIQPLHYISEKQQFPDTLITDYKMNYFNKKQSKPKKQNLISKFKKGSQKSLLQTWNYWNQSEQTSSPDQISNNVKQISYYDWLKQIQAEDEQVQKQKKNNLKLI